jgi:hypothetical protein
LNLGFAEAGVAAAGTPNTFIKSNEVVIGTFTYGFVVTGIPVYSHIPRLFPIAILT